jgi:aryl-alcohol dehydrogenase-like predicted oxidoreductase
MSEMTEIGKCHVARTLLPRARLEVSRIGLGLAHMHLLADDMARRQLLYRALDLGITHFDTSRFYSDGLSEITVGKFLAKNRNSITIATKFGLVPNHIIGSIGAAAVPLRKARSLLSRLHMIDYPRRSYTRSTMRKSLEASLRALKTDHIDIYLVHEPLLTSCFEDGLFDDLERERKKGTIHYVGISGATVDPVVAAHGDLLQVIQTSESSWNEKSEFVPDITHSLFSNVAYRKGNRIDKKTIRELLNKALARRANGAVIVQTRKPEHLNEVVSMAEGR